MKRQQEEEEGSERSFSEPATSLTSRRVVVLMSEELYDACRAEATYMNQTSLGAWVRQILATAVRRYQGQREQKSLGREEMRSKQGKGYHPSGWPKELRCGLSDCQMYSKHKGMHDPLEHGVSEIELAWKYATVEHLNAQRRGLLSGQLISYKKVQLGCARDTYIRGARALNKELKLGLPEQPEDFVAQLEASEERMIAAQDVAMQRVQEAEQASAEASEAQVHSLSSIALYYEEEEARNAADPIQLPDEFASFLEEEGVCVRCAASPCICVLEVVQEVGQEVGSLGSLGSLGPPGPVKVLQPLQPPEPPEPLSKAPCQVCGRGWSDHSEQDAVDCLDILTKAH